jgi:hypothetical protein
MKPDWKIDCLIFTVGCTGERTRHDPQDESIYRSRMGGKAQHVSNCVRAIRNYVQLAVICPGPGTTVFENLFRDAGRQMCPLKEAGTLRGRISKPRTLFRTVTSRSDLLLLPGALECSSQTVRQPSTGPILTRASISPWR